MVMGRTLKSSKNEAEGKVDPPEWYRLYQLWKYVYHLLCTIHLTLSKLVGAFVIVGYNE